MNNDVFLLGLDLGISTVKAGLFTLEGEMVGLESHEYPIIPEGDKVEVDPEHYWTPVVQSVRRLLAKWARDPARIAAVSASSHTETVIPMTREGKPARPALVWMDNRSQLEAEELRQEFGPQRVLEIGGQPDITPLWPVTKFRWLSKHEPETVQRTAKFLLPEDYLLYRLRGRIAEGKMGILRRCRPGIVRTRKRVARNTPHVFVVHQPFHRGRGAIVVDGEAVRLSDDTRS